MLDQQMKAAKQMIDLQKATVDGMINGINMFWSQADKMMETFLGQAVWMPEEGKRLSANGWRPTRRAVKH